MINRTIVLVVKTRSDLDFDNFIILFRMSECILMFNFRVAVTNTKVFFMHFGQSNVLRD